MNPLVIISKGKDPYDTTRRALKGFPLPDLQKRRILIKPNAGRSASPGQGVTTHPRVVEAAIDHLREEGGREIAIGEGFIFGVEGQEAFLSTGFKEISDRKKVRLYDLDRFDPAERRIPDGKLLRKVKISSALNGFDFIVSVPVMKTHMHTRVSLSIKNMKGLLLRGEKARLHHLRSDREIGQEHKALDLAISEMATILMPHLVIIDGTVGMEGMGPAYGKPKEMGVVLVGDNGVSADAVASRLMGFAPETIPHLLLSARRGLGEIGLEKIRGKPEDYLKWEDPFEPPPSTFSISFPDIMVYDEGSCSACLSTLLVLLRDYTSGMTGYRLADKKIHIAIGKGLKNCPEGTILIGNCTSRMKRRGVFVQGCPPVPSHITKTLSQKRGILGRKGQR
jgi:uncharacterized protein (DUF362 family)